MQFVVNHLQIQCLVLPLQSRGDGWRLHLAEEGTETDQQAIIQLIPVTSPFGGKISAFISAPEYLQRGALSEVIQHLL